MNDYHSHVWLNRVQVDLLITNDQILNLELLCNFSGFPNSPGTHKVLNEVNTLRWKTNHYFAASFFISINN